MLILLLIVDKAFFPIILALNYNPKGVGSGYYISPRNPYTLY